MKKLLVLFLAVIMCLGTFVACGGEDDTTASTNVATLEDAVTFLNSLYKTDEGKKTPANYKLAAQIALEGATFTVTWASDLTGIEFVLENGLYTVKVPAKNDTETTYKLTATVTAADGTTATKEFTRVLPVYDSTAAVTEPVEGEAYKLYLIQASKGLTVFADGKTQDNKNKFLTTVLDPKGAADFYAEKVEGGYKFYTTIDGAKKYVHSYTTTDENDKISKFIGFADTTDSVYYYKAEVKAWFVKCNNLEYVVGTYSSYETICLSDSTYITAENTGVSQFPMALMAKAAAEGLAPSVRPETNTDAAAIVNKLYGLESGASETGSFKLTGKITALDSYKNPTIVVEGFEDKPIYCYKLTDDRFVVGATITVTAGQMKNYNGTYEFMDCTLNDIVLPTGGDQGGNQGGTTTTKTPAEILTEAYALEAGATLAGGPYTLTGVIISVDTEYSTQYKNVTVTIVVDGLTDKPIQAFRIKGDGADQIAVGDQITVTGEIINYAYKNDAGEVTSTKVEFNTGTIDAWVDNTTSGGDEGGDEGGNQGGTTTTKTPAEILTEAYALEAGATLAGGPYTLTGVIISVDTEYSTQYKNVTVTIVVDGLTDKPIQAFRIKGDGADQIAVGDQITVTGEIINYAYKNDAGEVTSTKVEFNTGTIDAWVDNTTSGGDEGGDEGGDQGGTTDGVMTIPDVLASAEGTSVVVKGTVSEIYQAWNSQYSNMSFYISDASGNKLLVFRTGTQVGIGDEVTVTGTATLYNSVIQIAQGGTTVIDVVHVCSTFTDADCLNPKKCTVCDKESGTANGHSYANGVCTACGAAEVVGGTTASKTIAELITALGWDDTTTGQEFALDDNVTVDINGGNNTGKAYNGDHIRVYATDTPAGTITISVAAGYELVSVKVSTQTGTYAFLCVDGTTEDISNVSVTASGSSIVLNSVKNGSNGKQVRVTAIEVVYQAAE